MPANELRHSWTITDLATRFGGEVVGAINDVPPIVAAAPLEDATLGELAFFADRRYAGALASTRASCVLVPLDYPHSPADGTTYIKTPDPYRAFVEFLGMLNALRSSPVAGIHPTAVIEPSARIADSAMVGAGCVVGANAEIGENTLLYPNVILYENVRIGNRTTLHAGVVCYRDTEIGNDCIIHSGAVIGSDGFGYIENKDGSFDKIPHIGRVIVEDFVEIGANTTIDRSVAGVTRIGRGVKIDNLVQIAHNVRIGDNTAIAAQTGIAGSTVIGRKVRLAGQVGIVGHITLADGVIVLAQSGVGKSLAEPGMYLGSPVLPHGAALRLNASLRQLPDALTELRNEIRQLRERIAPKFDEFSDNETNDDNEML